MIRTLIVSTEVFAQIWSLRAPGEETEDAILSRVLASVIRSIGVQKPAPVLAVQAQKGNEAIPDGLEISRTYKGKEFHAKRVSGQWILQPAGSAFKSLNRLSRAVGPKTENAWRNWFFVDHEGRRRPVSELRETDKVMRRPRTLSAVSATQRETIPTSASPLPKVTWRDDVRSALEGLNRRAALSSIYKEVKKIRRAAGRSMPPSFDETVRRTLEENSSDSEVYRGGPDLFWMPEGKGAGVWALR